MTKSCVWSKLCREDVTSSSCYKQCVDGAQDDWALNKACISTTTAVYGLWSNCLQERGKVGWSEVNIVSKILFNNWGHETVNKKDPRCENWSACTAWAWTFWCNAQLITYFLLGVTLKCFNKCLDTIAFASNIFGIFRNQIVDSKKKKKNIKELVEKMCIFPVHIASVQISLIK